MSEKLHLTVEFELAQARVAKGKRGREEERAASVARALVAQALPSLASGAGVERNRLAGALLAELGYEVGLSLAPAAAMDVLAVATVRLRDAIVGRVGEDARIPAATIRGPRTLQ